MDRRDTPLNVDLPLPGEASESCPHCLQSYYYELEVRCIDCDGPACPFCVVTERTTLVTHRCGPCAQEAG